MKNIKQLVFIVIMIITLAAGSIVSYAGETVTSRDPGKTAAGEMISLNQGKVSKQEAVSEKWTPELSEETAGWETARGTNPELSDEATEPETDPELSSETTEPETDPELSDEATDTETDLELSDETTEPEKDPEEEPEPAVPVLQPGEVTKSSIIIRWGAVENAEQYEVYLYDGKANTWNSLGATEDTQYEYTAVSSGVEYRFAVAAKVGEVTGAYDEQGVSVVYLTPVQTKIGKDGNYAAVSWKQSTGAEGYTVFRRDAGKTSWTKLKDVSSTTLRYVDKTSKIGKTYDYLVRAYKKQDGAVWYSAYDNADAASYCMLQAPELKKTKTDEKGVKFTWKKVSGAKEYRVYRKTQKGKWKAIGYAKGGSYVDTKAKAGTVYYYSAAAISKQGIQGSCKTKGLAGIYLAPAAKPVVQNRTSGIALSWKKAKGAQGYRVYRKLTTAKKWKKIAEVKVRSYSDTSAKAGKSYQYMAVPYTVLKGKTFAAFRDARSQAEIQRLATPAVTMITSAGGGIRTTWNPVKGAKKYDIYRKTGPNGKWKLLASTSKKQYTDKNSKTGKLYYYCIEARSKKSTSDSSAEKAGMYLPAVKFKKTTSELSGLKLSWDSLKHATGYKIYRIEGNGELRYLGKTKKTTYTDKTAVDRTTYYYAVRAYNDSCKHCEGQYKKKGKKATYVDPLRKRIRTILDLNGWSLESAFNWARSIKFIDLQPEANNTRNYARWVLDNGKGDCYGKAAVFCMMARELGYECYVMRGFVPFANGGGSLHGWAEIYYGDGWYVCDIAYNNGGVNSAYLVKYGQKGTLRYTNYRRMP